MKGRKPIFYTYAGFGINPALVSQIILDETEKKCKALFFYKGHEEAGVIIYYPNNEYMREGIKEFMKLYKKTKFKIVGGKCQEKN